MYYIKKIIIIGIIFFTTEVYGYFSRDYISSKSVGIGNCGVVNDNSVIELQNNPALPMLNTRIGFEGLYFIRPVIDKYYNFIGGISFRLNDSIMFFSGTYQEILADAISTAKYFLGFNYALLSDVYMGYRIDMIRLSVSGGGEDEKDSALSSYSGFSAGIGIYYYVFDYLKVGLSYNGIDLRGSKKYIIPVINSGIDFQLVTGVNMYLQIKLKEDVTSSIGYRSILDFGINKRLNRYIEIRAGLPGSGFSLGLSINYKFVNIDYAAKFSLEAGNEHFIGVRILD